MPTPEQIAEWLEEFERIGETVIRDDLNLRTGVGVGINTEEKRIAVYNWLRGKERERADRERSSYSYVKWTFWAAVAAARSAFWVWPLRRT